MNSNVIELNETNFDREVLQATQPVLMEFWGSANGSDPLVYRGTMNQKQLSVGWVA